MRSYIYNITNILHNPDIARQTNAKGIKTFQHSVNSWSARKRGSVQRIHICTPTIVSDFNSVHAIPHPSPVVQSARRKLPMLGNGLFHPPKKITTPNIATRNIIAYKDKYKKANYIWQYSVGKPPISSDSASGISKGARLHSASEAIKEIA